MISLTAVQRAVLVTAHPDDETLWAGGLVLSTPGIAWTIVCCSIPRRDPDRFGMFDDACRALGAHPLKLPFVESHPTYALPHLQQLDALELGAYDLIVTHGPAGEYGHIHHQHLSRWLTDRFPNVATIGYRKGGIGEYHLPLTDSEWERKLTALKCYTGVLPYQGAYMPKWEALLRRYGTDFDLKTESYNGLSD